MRPSSSTQSQTNQLPRPRQSGQSGQIVIEYILLLIVVISIGGLLMRTLVSSDPNNAGVVYRVWQEVLIEVGKDKADEPAP